MEISCEKSVEELIADGTKSMTDVEHKSQEEHCADITIDRLNVEGNKQETEDGQQSEDSSVDAPVEEVENVKLSEPIISVDENNAIVITGEEGVLFFYTLDGSIPDTESMLYEIPFYPENDVVVKVIATKEGCVNSEVVTFERKKGDTKRVRLFTSTEDCLAISYQGESHIQSGTPCQDCHIFSVLNDNWRLAVVSDGAGSAANSQMGSAFVCKALEYYLKQILSKPEYDNGLLPDEKTWDMEFRSVLSCLYKDMERQFTPKNMSLKSLSATIILFVYSKNGYMAAHVGDGRAAVRSEGVWKSIMTPHKGEEANQTIFCTSVDFTKVQNIKMSGVYVPETTVCDTPIERFVLMSDGCESGLWHRVTKVDLPDGDFRYEKRNDPYIRGIESAFEVFDVDDESKESAIINFICDFNPALQKEIDDKTLLIGKSLW